MLIRPRGNSNIHVGTAPQTKTSQTVSPSSDTQPAKKPPPPSTNGTDTGNRPYPPKETNLILLQLHRGGQKTPVSAVKKTRGNPAAGFQLTTCWFISGTGAPENTIYPKKAASPK